MLASTGKANSETVIPLQQLQASYDIIPDNIPKVMDRRNTGDHGEMLYSGNGYVTAWLMWHLQGDMGAASAFTGAAPELFHNDLYQNQQSNFK